MPDDPALDTGGLGGCCEAARYGLAVDPAEHLSVGSGRSPDRCTVIRSRSWRSATAHPVLKVAHVDGSAVLIGFEARRSVASCPSAQRSAAASDWRSPS